MNVDLKKWLCIFDKCIHVPIDIHAIWCIGSQIKDPFCFQSGYLTTMLIPLQGRDNVSIAKKVVPDRSLLCTLAKWRETL